MTPDIAHEKQIENAKAMKPFIDAVADGKWLEFLHNDNQWRIVKGTNLSEVGMSPHRYRIAE